MTTDEQMARIFAGQIEADLQLRTEFLAAPERFARDPLFHHRVMQVARVLADDSEFAHLEPEDRRAATLGLAAKCVVVLERTGQLR
jgi:hypothetical protein